MFVGTSTEKFHYYNTLLCLVNSLQDKCITVDLRTDAYVCGTLTTVDGYMNLSLSNAIYCDPQSNEFYFENIFVHSRNIRYIHIPETMSLYTTIRDELTKDKIPKTAKKDVQKSRKATKALQLHMQTVASLGKP